MRKTLDFISKYFVIIGYVLMALTVFSSFILSGIVGMAQYGSYFNYIICALLILYMGFYILLKWREMYKDPYVIMIILFIVFNLITIALNTGIAFNLKFLILTATQWLVLFDFSRKNKTYTLHILNALNYCIFLVSAYGLFLFITNPMDMMDSSRFSGIYENPNMGSAIMFLSVALSFVLFSKVNNIKRGFLIVNIILEIVMMRLCMSRAGYIAILVFLIVFSIVYSFLRYRNGKLMIRNLALLLLFFFLIYDGVSLLVYNVHDYVKAQQIVAINVNESKGARIEKMKISKLSNGVTDMPLEPQTEVITNNIEKRDDTSTSESNNIRFTMIKSGLSAFLDKPFFGHGQNDLVAVVIAKTKVYLNGVEAGGVHNSYLQVLVANGLFGFSTFMGLQLLIFIDIIKKRKKIKSMKNERQILIFSSFIALYIALLFYGLFESVLILNSCIITSIFVISAGGFLNEKME